MANYRTGKSYLKPKPRIIITDPALHTLNRKISDLTREISQAEEIAKRFGFELPTWAEEKRQELAKLQEQLKV